jgi:hypothetical protein
LRVRRVGVEHLGLLGIFNRQLNGLIVLKFARSLLLLGQVLIKNHVHVILVEVHVGWRLEASGGMRWEHIRPICQ